MLIVAGFVAGFINVVAGGGSLITLPLLIFMGLPSAMANATNRVALFAQNIFAVQGFRSKGVSTFPYSLWLGISAMIGAIIGAKIAVEIDEALFNRILSGVMIMVAAVLIINPLKGIDANSSALSRGRQWAGIAAFFFVGIYGGFIQAGVGFLIIAVLALINRFPMVKINSTKVFVILLYSITSLAVFIMEGKVVWLWGITLAIGNGAGGWFASRWSVNKSDRLIKRILFVVVVIMSIKLWFFTE